MISDILSPSVVESVGTFDIWDHFDSKAGFHDHPVRSGVQFFIYRPILWDHGELHDITNVTNI